MNPLARAIMACAGASSPLTLPTTNLLAAYDARLGVTNVSGACSAWADQSGHGFHASQSTAGNRPTISTADGYASLLWNGTNSTMQASVTATSGPRTVYAVVKPTTLRGLFDTQSGRLFVGATGGVTHIIYDTGMRDTGVAVSTSLQQVTYQHSGGTFTFWRNGTQLASLACGANVAIGSACRIGSDYSGAAVTSGHILFLAIYSGTRNTDVEDYITQEWGV